MTLVGDKPEPLYKIMQSRKDYKILSTTSKIMGEQPNIDLTSGKPLYGKVNTENDPIILLPDLRVKAFLGSDVFGLGFVADAANDLMIEYNSRVQSSPGDMIEILRTLKVSIDRKTFNDVAFRRRKIIANYIVPYYARTNEANIANFEDFCRIFMRWAAEDIVNDPITCSGIILANSVANSISGLVVEFGNHNENDDFLKATIVADPNFPIYSNMAAKYGFYICKNAPWRLVANIESLIMQRYIDNYVLESHTSISQFFDDFYIKAHKLDLQDFRVLILALYNTFVHFNPIQKVKKVCPNGSLKVTNKRRVKTSLEELDEIYDPVWWLSKLFDVRCLETSMMKYTAKEKEPIYQSIANAFNAQGSIAALDYINEKIKERNNLFSR